MITSRDRILLTHVGSLPRNERLTDLLIRQEAGETIDSVALAREVDVSIADRIAKQVAAGVDIGNDGEQSRVAFQTYVPRCMCGFGGESKRPPARDQIEFPSYAKLAASRFPHSAKFSNAPAAISDVRYVDPSPVRADAARLKALGTGFTETFMTAPSPGIVATTLMNQHYESHEAYLMALSTALSGRPRPERQEWFAAIALVSKPSSLMTQGPGSSPSARTVSEVKTMRQARPSRRFLLIS